MKNYLIEELIARDRYTCCYCSWSGVDNWCLKRHLNTHLKPFACALCEYKAARAERLATHVLKVHNRRQCSRCSFLAEDLAQLQLHQLHVHRISNASVAAVSTAASPAAHSQTSSDRQQQAQPIQWATLFIFLISLYTFGHVSEIRPVRSYSVVSHALDVLQNWSHDSVFV